MSARSPLTREQAIDEAEKRERHKPRSLSHKKWTAEHDPVRGWRVALVDCPHYAVLVARTKASEALTRGSMADFVEAASEALLASCRATLSEPASVDTHPEGRDANAARFMSGAVPSQTGDAQPSSPTDLHSGASHD